MMKDPVTLPSSRVVVDRATIKAHLLSDAKDPFNRVPLKIEEVIPSGYHPTVLFEGFELTFPHVLYVDPELKARIDEFLATKHAERHGKKAVTN